MCMAATRALPAAGIPSRWHWPRQSSLPWASRLDALDAQGRPAAIRSKDLTRAAGRRRWPIRAISSRRFAPEAAVASLTPGIGHAIATLRRLQGLVGRENASGCMLLNVLL